MRTAMTQIFSLGICGRWKLRRSTTTSYWIHPTGSCQSHVRGEQVSQDGSFNQVKPTTLTQACLGSPVSNLPDCPNSSSAVAIPAVKSIILYRPKI
eukprot:scaffold818_cov136-Cylindrotheca_fusiformis.AAC.41